MQAAARLTESIGKAIEQRPAPEVSAALIPTGPSTLHRLLGAIPNRAECDTTDAIHFTLISWWWTKHRWSTYP
ncbi:hypothetical protein O9992_13260 [Vibrio lentus]|nr:hypothetical protein [Vibrio lentus]